MEDLRLGNGNGFRSSTPTLRDLLSVGFRHRRLFAISFLTILVGAIGAAVLGSRYQAQMKILVRKERLDPMASTSTTPIALQTQRQVTEEEMNSEVEVIKSGELLADVAVACGLQNPKHHFWSSWLPNSDSESFRIAKAVKSLSGDLKVEPVRKSDLILVSYTSSSPELSARVLATLGNLYLAKHLAVHRPSGEFSFFDQQAQSYRQALTGAEERLANFGREEAAAPATERDIALQKVNDLDITLGQQETSIAGTQARIKALEEQLASTPAWVKAQAKTTDNGALVENTKSQLLTLELKRTELLSKFDPNYPPVKEVEAQIAQTKAAIEEAQKSPVLENTTEPNPTYQWLTSELARAKADLPTLQASATTTHSQVSAYRERILSLDRQGVEHQSLMREAKADEANYLLYLSKREEARIDDAMDNRRISNVALAQMPAVPALPLYSPWLVIFLGGMLALLVSSGLAFAAEYLDPSFRTADEVSETLDLPVFASIPKNGH